MNSHSICKNKLQQTAKYRWPEIFKTLAITVPKSGKQGPCPICNAGHDRFHFDNKEGSGSWHCRKCPEGQRAGYGLKLVELALNMTFKEALHAVSEAINLPLPHSFHKKKISSISIKTAQRARSIWSESLKADFHPYLKAKGLELPCHVSKHPISIADIDFDIETLIVPLYFDNHVVNIQFINECGQKRFLYGGQTKYAYHPIKGNLKRVWITEGYATGLSLALATDDTVLCAFSASNLKHITSFAKETYNSSQIIIAADNDIKSDINKGLSAATAAAKENRAIIITPPSGGDWNDYHQTHGLDKLKSALNIQLSNTETIDNKVDLPTGYYIENSNLIYKAENKTAIKVCSELIVTALTHDKNEYNYGKFLKWKTYKGTVREWAMPMNMLSSNGDDIRKTLLSGGLPYIGSSAQQRALLLEFLSLSSPSKTITCVDTIGWHQDSYVLPNYVLGNPEEDIVFQSPLHIGSDFTQKGTHKEWKDSISYFCSGNSRLLFAVSMAFAAPLTRLIGAEGFGVNFFGQSGIGKTTLANVAASVYGDHDFVTSWKATGNALELIAQSRNDALLCLDELKEVNAHEAIDITYMLANGKGKSRSTKDSNSVNHKSWQIVYLSTGELSLAEHVSTIGSTTYAGAEGRMLQIPANTGTYGIFDNIHNFSGGAELADYLNSTTKKFHGTPLIAFLDAFIQQKNIHINTLKTIYRGFINKHQSHQHGTQVSRTIRKFALVAAAGELATKIGVTGWNEGEAFNACTSNYQAWLTDRGHGLNKEEAQVLSVVNKYLLDNLQNNQFESSHASITGNSTKVGFTKDIDGTRCYLIPPSKWKELTGELNPRAAAETCIKHGWLVKPQQKGYTAPISNLSYFNSKRFYRFTDKATNWDIEL